jgi:hypothetical protein
VNGCLPNPWKEKVLDILTVFIQGEDGSGERARTLVVSNNPRKLKVSFQKVWIIISKPSADTLKIEEIGVTSDLSDSIPWHIPEINVAPTPPISFPVTFTLPDGRTQNAFVNSKIFREMSEYKISFECVRKPKTYANKVKYNAHYKSIMCYNKGAQPYTLKSSARQPKHFLFKFCKINIRNSLNRKVFSSYDFADVDKMRKRLFSIWVAKF